jgi:hypothetical protein
VDVTMADAVDHRAESASVEGKENQEMDVQPESVGDALAQKTTVKFGHLLQAASRSAPLPLTLMQSVCDFLTVKELACTIAVASRTGYATCIDYAQLVHQQSNPLRVDVHRAARAALPTASSSSSSSSSSRASFPDCRSRFLGARLDVRYATRVATDESLDLLLSSRLRSLVTRLDVQRKSLDCETSVI